MFIVDAHLDLAYNALNYGRSLTNTLAAIRAAEPVNPGPRGVATVSLPDMRACGVRLVFGTLFAQPAGIMSQPGDKLVYHDQNEAYSLASRQLDYYHQLADEIDYVRLVTNQTDLDWVSASHATAEPALGIVPLMEGADPVRAPEELELWYERGLRLIGPAWSNTRYADGAGYGRGGFTPDGDQLLEAMADFGFILDVTHLSEQASLEALDRYEGPLVASHSNCRALVPGARHLDDTQIRRLGERDGVIGVVLFNRFLRRDYRRGDPKARVTLNHVVAHVDHICQVLGDAAHVGIGSDLDGGFGAADIPAGMDSAADLPSVAAALRERGYDEDHIQAIMGGNWVSLLRRALPA